MKQKVSFLFKIFFIIIIIIMIVIVLPLSSYRIAIIEKKILLFHTRVAQIVDHKTEVETSPSECKKHIFILNVNTFELYCT